MAFGIVEVSVADVVCSIGTDITISALLWFDFSVDIDIVLRLKLLIL